MKKFISITLVLMLLCAALVLTLPASAGVENIVGYSAQRVVKVDLTAVEDITNIAAKPDATEYKITSVEGLQELEYQVNSAGKNFEGVTIYLANDIYPEEQGLVKSIGNNTTQFMGTFDGQGYTIENVKLAEVNNGGLFGYVKDATVKNVILGEKTVINTSKNQSGGIIGRIQGTKGTFVDNCWNKATISAEKAQMVGGIVGQNYGDEGFREIKTVITNCTNSAKITAKGRMGGILGRAASPAEVKNCLNTGEIVAVDTTVADTKVGAGGIIGESGFTANESGTVIVEGCVNTGNVTAATAAGGIMALLPDGKSVTVKGCANYGTPTATGEGGFAAQIIGRSIVSVASVVLENNLEKKGQTWTPVETDPPAAPLEPQKPDTAPDTEPDVTPDTDPADTGSNSTSDTAKKEDTTPTTSAQDKTSDTKAADTEEEENGCGGVIGGAASVMGIAVLCAALISKRRKDD